jgi:hypothetical protein
VRAAAVIALCAPFVGVAGCGGSGHRTSPSSQRQAEALIRRTTACGDLKARLNGINERRGITDPQRATLVGRHPAIELSRASREAVAADREAEAELRGSLISLDALLAIERTQRSYARLAHSLQRARAAGIDAGLSMHMRLVRLEDDQLYEACGMPLR